MFWNVSKRFLFLQCMLRSSVRILCIAEAMCMWCMRKVSSLPFKACNNALFSSVNCTKEFVKSDTLSTAMGSSCVIALISFIELASSSYSCSILRCCVSTNCCNAVMRSFATWTILAMWCSDAANWSYAAHVIYWLTYATNIVLCGCACDRFKNVSQERNPRACVSCARAVRASRRHQSLNVV